MIKTNKIIDYVLEELKERKAIDPIALNVKNLSSFTDFLIIASMDSERGVKALYEHINEKLKKELKVLTKTDGYSSPSWIIIDTGEIMIHLFHKKTREYYNLESLWSDKK